MKKRVGLLFFFSSMLWGMSDTEFRSARQQIQDRIFTAQQDLACKNGERAGIEQRVVGAEKDFRGLQAFLQQEKSQYEGQCRKLQDDIAYYDPAAVVAQLEARVTGKVQAGQEAIIRAQREHQKKKAVFEAEMAKRLQKKEALRADIEKLQNVVSSQPETLQRVQACIALFNTRCVSSGTSVVTLQDPPAYATLPSSVSDAAIPVMVQQNSDVSMSYGTFLQEPSAPPAYDDVSQREK